MKIPAPLPLALTFVLLACDRGPGPDEALYQRAHDAGVARRSDQAEGLYRQLLAQHPSSKYSPDAHLALAEIAFNAGAFVVASNEYQAVLAHPEHKTWGFALYKQGWCHLNQGRPAEARASWERLVALEHDERLPPDRAPVLVSEARRALVKAWAADNGPEGAGDYFQRWGGPDTALLLEALGDAYFDAGKADAAATIFRELVATHAAEASPRLCVWQNRVVRTAFASGARADQVREVQHLGAVLARLEQAAPGPAAEGCRLTLRDTLKELALLTHKTAQREKAPELLEVADPLYRQYLTRFRAEKDAATMTFFHAELLWSLGRFPESAAEYAKVVELDPKGKLVKEAAYAHLLATKNALHIDEEGRAPGPAAAAAGTLPPAQKQMIAAIELYLEHVSDTPELPRLLYRRARIYYDHGLHAEAAARFRDFIARFPDDELGAFAINLELDALSTLGRAQDVCAAVARYRTGAQARKDKELARTLEQIGKGCRA